MDKDKKDHKRKADALRGLPCRAEGEMELHLGEVVIGGREGWRAIQSWEIMRQTAGLDGDILLRSVAADQIARILQRVELEIFLEPLAEAGYLSKGRLYDIPRDGEIGLPALALAVESRNLHAVRVLLRHGADPEDGAGGRSPLDRAKDLVAHVESGPLRETEEGAEVREISSLLESAVLENDAEKGGEKRGRRI